MLTDLKSLFQILYSAVDRHPRCRRGICHRYRRCVPPPHGDLPLHYRCRFDASEKWQARNEVAGKVAERLMKIHATARGIPFPFTEPPASDHLNLDEPFDSDALLEPFWGPPDDGIRR